MNINLHIERVTLDKIMLSPGDSLYLKKALKAELTHLFESGDLRDDLQSACLSSQKQSIKNSLICEVSIPSLSEHISRAVFEVLTI